MTTIPSDASTAVPRAQSAPVVIYHGGCPDGFAAALSAWLHFGGAGEYIPMVHAQNLPDLTGKDVFMLDIAFDRDKMEKASAQAKRLVVLDHHQSAADALHGFKCRCGSITFDFLKSAARMSWEYFHPGTELPALIAHVEDRDLLKWMLEDTCGYLAALDVGPYNFNRWAGVMGMHPEALERFMARGQAMHTQSKKLAAEMANDATPIEILGHKGLMANAPNVFHSAVGELLLKRCGTYALLWCLEGGGARIKVGLRGAEDFDVIPLATAFGGGGHPYAAAFRLPLDRISDLLSGSLAPKQ